MRRQDDFCLRVGLLDFLQQEEPAAGGQFGFSNNQARRLLFHGLQGRFSGVGLENRVFSLQQHRFQMLAALGDIINDQDRVVPGKHVEIP